MSQIKLIISDFDDTIRDTATGEIPESFWRARDRLRARGIEIIIATGRVKHSLENLMKDSDLQIGAYPGIFANGSVMYDRKGEITVLGQFSETQASEIFEYLKLLKKAGVKVDFGVSGIDRSYGFSQDGEEKLTNFLNEEVYAIETIQDIITKHDDIPLSFCWLCEDSEINALVRKLIVKAFPDLDSPDCLFEFSRGYMIDPKIGKASAIRTLLAELKISEKEIIVIGDGTNDIGMLDAFDHSIVMGNAAEWLKEKHGKHVAPCLKDDGWARGVEGFLAQLECATSTREDTVLSESHRTELPVLLN